MMTTSQTPVPLDDFHPPASSSGTGTRFTRQRYGSLATDAGMTLVEIIVTVVILGILSAVITGIFVNGIISQQQTALRDKTTGQANAVSEQLARSVRNAGAFRVDATGHRVDAAVLQADGSWRCEAWVLDTADPSAGRLRYSGGDTPRGADSSTWGVLALPVTGTLTSPSAHAAFDAVGARSLAIGIAFEGSTTTDGSELPFSARITAQARTEGAIPTC